MPELPEVQTIVNDLNAAGLVGATIRQARVFWPRIVATPAAETFCEQLQGQTIRKIWRRAKYLVIDLSRGAHLLIHLRMSGRLLLVSSETERSKHEHVIVDFADQRQLRYHDTRKFGRWYLVADVATVLGKLGPEPLTPKFTAKLLGEGLHAHKRMVKPLLLDQAFIAGLGNIYVDEALWTARLHPRRLAATVTDAEVKALHRAIRKVLTCGIKNFGTSLGGGKANFSSIGQRTGSNREQLNVFHRARMPCPRCQTIIERIIVGQRSTHVCPACQKL